MSIKQCIKLADEQEDAILDVHQVKKGGCLSNLLVAILESECAHRSTVVVTPKDIQSFQSFRRFREGGLLLDVSSPSPGARLPEGFFVLVNANQKPIGATDPARRGMCVRLTGLGRWMAIALLLDVSLFGMCLAAEINAHYAGARDVARNGVQDDPDMIAPFTTIRFARRFPSCSRCKITRARQELEEAGMVSVSKTMHCNMIRSNPAHSLFSKYSPILAEFASALRGTDTLEGTSRVVMSAYSVLQGQKCLKSR